MTPSVFEGLCCGTCGTEVNVLEHPEFREALCPECLESRVLWVAAGNHIQANLKAPIEAWFNHWQAAGVEGRCLEDILEDALRKVSEDFQALPETGTPA